MMTGYTWDELKRAKDLAKHGLDFEHADLVLESPYRLDVDIVRNGEARVQLLAYALNVLAVLTVVYVPGAETRIVSFRRASREERYAYHDWLAQEP